MRKAIFDAVQNAKRSICPNCKRQHAHGDEVVRDPGGYLYHPGACYQARIDRLTAQEHGTPVKESPPLPPNGRRVLRTGRSL